MERLFKRIIYNETSNPVFWLINSFLWFLSFFYRIGVGLNKRMVKTSRIKEAVVISVGNITSGGTGKTPLVMWLAEKLNRSHRVAVLSRGYGGKLKGGFGVVSDGHRIMLDQELAGDEPYLIAQNLPVPVVVGKDRGTSANYAVGNFRSEVLILDDGFQYFRLKRDIDIVLLDATAPVDNGYLLPRGLLREPLTALKRADIIILTRVNQAPGIEETIRMINQKNPGVSIFKASHRPVCLKKNNRIFDLRMINGKRVLAVSSIGNPASFEDILKKELKASVIKSLSFNDHHKYTDKDIDKIKRLSNDVDYLITTEKDKIRLEKYELSIYALKIQFKIEGEDRFMDLLGYGTGHR